MMRRCALAFLLGIAPLLFAACGSSVQEGIRADAAALRGAPVQVRLDNVSSSTDKIPPYVVGMLKFLLEKELEKRGFMAEQPRQLALRVDMKDYRDRGAVVRLMFGVFAGADSMESNVELLDPQDNRVLAQSTVKSFNAMAVAAMDWLAQLHAAEIAKYVEDVLKGSK